MGEDSVWAGVHFGVFSTFIELFKQVIWGEIWQLPLERNTSDRSDRTERIDKTDRIYTKDRTEMTDRTDMRDRTDRPHAGQARQD